MSSEKRVAQSSQLKTCSSINQVKRLYDKELFPYCIQKHQTE